MYYYCYSRSCVKEVLHNVTFGNYYNLAQNGSSTSYIELLQGKYISIMLCSLFDFRKFCLKYFLISGFYYLFSMLANL